MQRERRGFLGLGWVVLAGLVGCGDAADEGVTVGYSGPVNIRLDKFKEDEVRNGAFDSDKNVNTENGNPYGAFLQAARARLGGNFTADNAAAAVALDAVTLTIDQDTRGVTAFEQVLGGPLQLYLASSSTTVNVGTVAQPTGAGPVRVTLTADLAALEPIRRDLLNGSFKVGIRVPAAASLPRTFDLRIATTLTFRAVIR
ncbi:MAG: hypothetical protein JNK72_16735 [Myxococcales bacterium]|nr:hypothetical protein [Myxococcales bacterium]